MSWTRSAWDICNCEWTAWNMQARTVFCQLEVWKVNEVIWCFFCERCLCLVSRFGTQAFTLDQTSHKNWMPRIITSVVLTRVSFISFFFQISWVLPVGTEGCCTHVSSIWSVCCTCVLNVPNFPTWLALWSDLGPRCAWIIVTRRLVNLNGHWTSWEWTELPIKCAAFSPLQPYQWWCAPLDVSLQPGSSLNSKSQPSRIRGANWCCLNSDEVWIESDSGLELLGCCLLRPSLTRFLETSWASQSPFFHNELDELLESSPKYLHSLCCCRIRIHFSDLRVCVQTGRISPRHLDGLNSYLAAIFFVRVLNQWMQIPSSVNLETPLHHCTPAILQSPCTCKFVRIWFWQCLFGHYPAADEETVHLPGEARIPGGGVLQLKQTRRNEIQNSCSKDETCAALSARRTKDPYCNHSPSSASRGLKFRGSRSWTALSVWLQNWYCSCWNWQKFSVVQEQQWDCMSVEEPSCLTLQDQMCVNFCCWFAWLF